jgi:chemotaxis-related protein WspB
MSAYDDDRLPLLVFRLGDQHYALPVAQVIEVAAMVDLITLPETTPEVLGLANRHGDALPILDLRRIFEQPPQPITTTCLFIVARAMSSQMVGLVVDEVAQVSYIERSNLRAARGTGRYIKQVASGDHHILQVIDLQIVIDVHLPIIEPD